MLYFMFQYGWEPVLIHRIFTGFKAILTLMNLIIDRFSAPADNISSISHLGAQLDSSYVGVCGRLVMTDNAEINKIIS